MRSARGAANGAGPRNAGNKKRSGPHRPSGFRLSPARQTLFVVLALSGIAAGYGLGFLFKGQAPAPTASIATPHATAAPVAAQPGPAPSTMSASAPPLLPEGAKPSPQAPVRAYEEALPKDIVAHNDAAAVGEPALRQSTPEGTPEKAAGPAVNQSPAVQTAPADAVPSAAPPAARVPPPDAVRENGNLPAWRKFAVAVPTAEGRHRIALVIDDLGVDKPRTQRVIRLRAPLTLSFLTYASGLKELTTAAHAAGHELLMHVPMEPGSTIIDPGPNVLLTGIPAPELEASLRWNLDQFDGYVGINNHMGSRFTADLPGMLVVMEELKRRKLLFLDSVTAPNSVAGRAARRVGVPFARRNVFIDNEDNVEAITKQLLQVERLAAQTGVAVAIGHPREATLNALIPWLDGIEARGFQLVPISAVIAPGPSSRG